MRQTTRRCRIQRYTLTVGYYIRAIRKSMQKRGNEDTEQKVVSTSMCIPRKQLWVKENKIIYNKKYIYYLEFRMEKKLTQLMCCTTLLIKATKCLHKFYNLKILVNSEKELFCLYICSYSSMI